MPKKKKKKTLPEIFPPLWVPAGTDGQPAAPPAPWRPRCCWRCFLPSSFWGRSPPLPGALSLGFGGGCPPRCACQHLAGDGGGGSAPRYPKSPRKKGPERSNPADGTRLLARPFPPRQAASSFSPQIYIYIFNRQHTHTHIYIYIPADKEAMRPPPRSCPPRGEAFPSVPSPRGPAAPRAPQRTLCI